jgi:hypothetical protein
LPDYSVIQSGLPYLEVNKCVIREVSQEDVSKA